MTVIDPTAYAGYKAHTTARSTGTVVILFDAEEQGIDPSDGGKYLLVCEGPPGGETHAGSLNEERSEMARYMMRHPDQWCPYCQGDPVG